MEVFQSFIIAPQLQAFSSFITINIMNPAVQHIIENSNLFGFGSQESALLQSFKELVENSIDACKSSLLVMPSVNKMKIRATITQSEYNPQFIILEVEDEGIGMLNPEALLMCFATNKDADNEQPNAVGMTGRFGVGLSTCLIYSLVHTNIPMRLVTKCHGASYATVADFSLDILGNPKAVQSCVVQTTVQGGTKIRLHLPLDLSTRVTALHKHFKIQLDTSYPLAFALTTRSPEALSISSTSSNTIRAVSSTNGNIENCVSTQLKERLNRYYKPTQQTQYHTAITIDEGDRTNTLTVGGNSDIDSNNGTSFFCTTKAMVYHMEENSDTSAAAIAARYEIGVFVAVIEKQQTIIPMHHHQHPSETSSNYNNTNTISQEERMTDNTVSNNNNHHHHQQHHQYQSSISSPSPLTNTNNTNTYTTSTATIESLQHLPLQIWRYVNHIPLLDMDDDALSCGITAAVRGIHWNRYEYKLKLSIDVPETNAVAVTTGMTLDPPHMTGTGVIETKSPQWELHSKRIELSDLLQANQYQLIIAVDIQGAKIPFSNMRKTCLGNEDRVLIKQIQQGIQKACQKLQSTGDANVQALFMTTKQYKENQMRHKYIPSIASSMSKIYALQNAELQAWTLEKLSIIIEQEQTLEDEQHHSQQDHISTVIEHKLRSILHYGNDDEAIIPMEIIPME